jgi:ribonuclease BN (tRNA processing enzyme)
VLVHEVYSAARFQTRPPEWQAYHSAFHTSTTQLAGIAGKARPRLLVLYHQLFWGATDADLEREIAQAGYTGKVISGRDLDVF